MYRLIYTQFAAAFAYLLVRVTEAEAIRFSAEIAQGTAQAPYQYRVLVPVVYNALISLVDASVLTWSIWFLLLAFFALIIDQFCRFYFEPATVMLWTVIATATVTVLIYAHSGVFPYWAGLEAVLFAAALLLLHRQQYGSLLALVIIATLNRETALFMVVMVAFVTHNARLTIVLGLAWAFVYGMIRFYYGPQVSVFTVQQTLAVNLQLVSLTTVVLLPWFCGSLLYAAWKGRHVAPELVRRAALFIPFYLLAVAIFGVWTEIRLLMPAIPVLAPMAMAAFQNETSSQVAHGSQTVKGVPTYLPTD